MTVIVAPIFGPLLGGWISDNYVAVDLLHQPADRHLLGDLRVFPAARPRDERRSSGSTRSVALLVIGVSCLQMMLDLGKDRDWFNSTFIVALALIAVVSLAFMLVWEATEKEPVVDLSLFRTATSRSAR